MILTIELPFLELISIRLNCDFFKQRDIEHTRLATSRTPNTLTHAYALAGEAALYDERRVAWRLAQ
jgi:hypothetical protein